MGVQRAFALWSTAFAPLRPLPHRPPLLSSVPRALRELAALVLCCLLLQALMLPAQRTAQRLHVHLAPLLAPDWSLPTSALFTERRQRAPDTDHGHGHTQAAAHAHSGEEGRDMMLLAAHDADPPASAAAVLKRHLFDQDATWARSAAASAATPARVVAADPPPHPRSHVEPPLERPPRALV